jgi:tRNA 2-thiocytidine biosynthesis protein TtcA
LGKCNVALKDKLAYYVLKNVNKAIREYEMIADGDRIAVAVSGGKDSLTLLHLLSLRQRCVPEKYTAVAVHVVTPWSGKTSCSQPETRTELEAYFKSLGQDCTFETLDVEESVSCFRCSYRRRKALFLAAQRTGCNKVALGHHSDDAVQTTLLSLFSGGRVETLYPKREFFGGQFVLIRPMIYVSEEEIARLAQACGFPVIADPCPHSSSSRRVLVKNMLATLKQEFPDMKTNLLRAGLRGVCVQKNK